ncbi:MAG: hypothetical protein VX426_06845 [Chloroflexota bacterium]|nr:hypothetical protein [Chloroflexota bacterium]|tara:strand:+ start:256 stop:504 length:249 start_codon:yes stop_codon:yes gene_type:complete
MRSVIDIAEREDEPCCKGVGLTSVDWFKVAGIVATGTVVDGNSVRLIGVLILGELVIGVIVAGVIWLLNGRVLLPSRFERSG